MRPLRLTLAVCLTSLAPAAAQQFQYQPGVIPGVARWTEGVECADVDNDGDIDIFFGEGDGFSSAGTQRQNILIVNKLIEIGPNNFADESITRLGANLSNAKGVTTGDVDGDGFVDALFANAFNTDTPFLYMNRGMAAPGFFTMQSAARGLTEILSSAGAQFGDLDDDGDLDLIVNDSGSSFLGGAGDEPRLYFNDGAGYFTENAAALGAVAKAAQMDVQLIDIDNDWDLDFVGVNRGNNAGGNHYLMLNDGAGSFMDASSMIPAFSTATYEAEVGDLDGDDDIDLFFVSLSGFQEGHVGNNLVPSGNLSFTAGAPLNGNIDDNEIVLIDYDNDQDYDVFVGSLGVRERLYRNDGSLSWTLAQANVQPIADPTLDATAADLDGDGDYDLITAQGEGNPGQFANKLYENTGAADTHAPIIVAIDAPPTLAKWNQGVHARVRDQVMDDGVNYVSAHGAYAPVVANDAIDHTGGAFSPNLLNVSVGTRVVFTNMDGGAQSVTSVTSPYAYDLQLAGTGGTADYVFVSPGIYDFESSASAATGRIVVTGTAQPVDGVYSGGGQYRFAIAPLAGTPSNEFALELFFTDHPGNVSVSASRVIGYPVAIGTPYCSPAVANSTGQPGALTVTGSDVLGDNGVVLAATNLPPGQFGYFLTSQTPALIMNPGGSSGNLCVSGNLGRYARQIKSSGPDGVLSLTIDLTDMPTNPHEGVLSGQTWNFQAWHRDVMSDSNFTDAVALTF